MDVIHHVALTDVNGIAVGKVHARDGFILRPTFGNGSGHRVDPFQQDRSLRVEIGGRGDRPVSGHEVVHLEGADPFESIEPLRNIGCHQPGLAFGEHRIAREHDPFLRDVDRHLAGRVPWGMQELKGVLTDAQRQEYEKMLKERDAKKKLEGKKF